MDDDVVSIERARKTGASQRATAPLLATEPGDRWAQEHMRVDDEALEDAAQRFHDILRAIEAFGGEFL